ncbi:MAG: PD-(D/E)XK nuclease family protein [Deltaproteobacteria bacterium]|nr:PD-(D/E)XK nuclease family protein [Deltaproteobacteria bacterium]
MELAHAEAAETLAAATPAPNGPPAPRRVLTHSAMEAWSRCEVEYRLAYEERLVPTAYPAALAVGTAVHAGVETLHLGLPLPEAYRSAALALQRFLDRACSGAGTDTPADLERQLEFDMAKVRAMLAAWTDRYLVPAADGTHAVDRDLDIVATEQVLEAPLVNPLTGRPSRSFRLAGKLDAIARRRGNGSDGSYVVELKTTGEDLDEFLEAMTVSAQPAVYQVLAESRFGAGHGQLPGTVLDIIRKPTIRPKKDESPAEFEQRAIEAYRSEPERFVRRVVLPPDPQLRREVMVNAWRIADGIRRAERYGYVSKKGPACRGAYGPCRYRPLCWHGDATGFVTKETEHEELLEGP